MRNGQVIAQNVPFSSVISKPLSRWWLHHDIRLWCLGSNLAYLHSKEVRNTLKRKYTKYFLVINEPWSRWWRHHDVIKHSSSLTQSHHSYQVWLGLNDKRQSYCVKCTIFVRNQWTVKLVMTSTRRHYIMFVLTHTINHLIKFGEGRM